LRNFEDQEQQLANGQIAVIAAIERHRRDRKSKGLSLMNAG
jgi:hypothetical protein